MTFSTAFSQTSLQKVSYKSEEIKYKQKAKPGTYQFLVFNRKLQYYFTEETFLFIEEQRQQKNDVTLHLNPMTDVYIPSKEKINSKEFILLTEYHYK